ncbi:hypothetical protein [Parasitella parasitica]|uniref:Rho-GAP domain-containing protein n=1 Tax=Parasitella parasitica TaxID=35722 RepID=A0A0B7NAS8_9FUNG|nr:hypothetical protein [Parasitella parasitica]
MLRTRLSAEEAYLVALNKVKKLASNDGPPPDSQLSFQNAVKFYESTISDVIKSRELFKDTIRLEIDVLVKQKEIEENSRKTYKAKLYDANNNYTMFRNRDITKLQKTYTHKCEDLKIAQNSWQQQQIQQQGQQQQQQELQQPIMQQPILQQPTAPQQQQQQQQIESNDFFKPGRNSIDSPNPSRSSGDYVRDIDIASIASHNNADQHNKKGMAGLISQMRTRAAGNTYLAPLDQNKQIAKFAKMKKDIADADNEYREGILVLENLRKKQTKTAEEVNRQLQSTIKRKTETVKTSLRNILRSELESLQAEMNISRSSYDTAACIDSSKDIQMFNKHYQNQRYCYPTPVRYENFYFEGKCKEVLFGGSLETYAIEHNRTVPLIVIKCIESIEKMGGLQKEGIYRVSGRQANIEHLKHQFELDEDRVSLDTYDVFTIATVLKMYIRELKRPLFDFNVQSRSSYNKNMPQINRFQLMETKLSNLSLAHRSTLLFIVRHLAKVNANSQINKMNIPNLAMIFTPVIFHDFNQTEEGLGEWSPDDLFEDLILHFELLFPKAEDMARRNNEPKLQQALEGKSPYSQFSQSNLLYLTLLNNTPNTSNSLLLTQPMNPPIISGNNRPSSPVDQQCNNQYPPQLTTIIGTAPSVSSYHQPQPQHPQQYLQQPRQDICMNRSISDNTIMQRSSSMVNVEESYINPPLPDLKDSNDHFVKGVATAPPRHESLRKLNYTRFQNDDGKVLEEQPRMSSISQHKQTKLHAPGQYQAGLNPEYFLSPVMHPDEQNIDSPIGYCAPSLSKTDVNQK